MMMWMTRRMPLHWVPGECRYTTWRMLRTALFGRDIPASTAAAVRAAVNGRTAAPIASAPARRKMAPHGRGLHSFTLQLNGSTFGEVRLVHDFPPVY